jgi:ppGpp synthetase/RelA/SpoT-type nucleotidyltranferase
MEAYSAVRQLYQELATVIAALLESALRARGIRVAAIQQRAKEVESFGDKAAKSSPEDAAVPKYTQPLHEIEDMAGVRVITIFLGDIEEVERVIRELFSVCRRENKGEGVAQEDLFGYQSVHYIVSMPEERLKLMELPRLEGLRAEIQVRTVLQHAWAEIEHDIQYKTPNAASLSVAVRRRFADLAGLLEIADRELQAIQDEDLRSQDERRLQDSMKRTTGQATGL